VIVLAGIGK